MLWDIRGYQRRYIKYHGKYCQWHSGENIDGTSSIFWHLVRNLSRTNVLLDYLKSVLYCWVDMVCPVALTFATLKLFLELFLLLTIWYLWVHIHVHREVIKRVIQTYWRKELHVKIKCLITIIMFSKKIHLCYFILFRICKRSPSLFFQRKTWSCRQLRQKAQGQAVSHSRSQISSKIF